MKSTKILSTMLVSILAISLASCGNKESTDIGYDGSEVEITLVTTASETKLKPIIDAAIADFNVDYPNIHVTHNHADGYDTLRDNISKQLSVDSQPDIAYCYADHVALYNKSKKVITLDEYIDDKDIGFTQEQKDDFIPAFYDEGKKIEANGKMYCLPFLKSTEVLFYNKTFFDQNNLKVPTTWDEMETVCTQIKGIEPTATPLGYDSAANWFITMCEQGNYPYTVNDASQGYFLFDNTDTKAFVKRFCEWYQKGYVTTQNIYGGYTSGLFKTENKISTKTGKMVTRALMCIGSSAGASNQCPTKNEDGSYPFEVGVAQIPQLDVNHPKVISQGPSLCIFKHNGSDSDQRTVASWLLVKSLLTNKQFQIDFALASGYVPSIKSVKDYTITANGVTTEVWNDSLKARDGNANLAQSAIYFAQQQSENFFTSPAFVGSSSARDSAETLLSGCMSKSVTVDNDVVTNKTSEEITSIINQAFADQLEICKYNAGL